MSHQRGLPRMLLTNPYLTSSWRALPCSLDGSIEPPLSSRCTWSM